jgi:hypothetical protein
MADEFDVDSYFAKKFPNSQAADDTDTSDEVETDDSSDEAPVRAAAEPAYTPAMPGTLAGASTAKRDALKATGQKKIADLKQYLAGWDATNQPLIEANKKAWTGRLGLDVDSPLGEAVNLGASVVDGTAKVGTQIINMVPTLNAAAINQGIPDAVKLAHMRYENNAMQPGDEELLALPFGDTDPNRPLSKFQAIARAEAKKTGKLSTNMDRMNDLKHALKFGEDLRAQTDISSIVNKTNQQGLEGDLKDTYKPNADKITSGWDKGGIDGAADIASGIAGLIGGVGEAAWKNPAAAMELIASNTPQLAAAALSGGAMLTTNVAYAMEEYSKGIAEYQKNHDGLIPSQEELAVMAAKAGSLAVAETLGDKFMLGAKVIPGSGKVGSALEKSILTRVPAAAAEGAVGEALTEGYQTAMERNIEGKPFDGEETYVGASMGAIAGGGMSSVHGIGRGPERPNNDGVVPPVPGSAPAAVKEAQAAAKETGDVSALTDPENAAYDPVVAVQSLMSHASEKRDSSVTKENLTQVFDIVDKLNNDLDSQIESLKGMDPKAPETIELSKQIKAQERKVEQANTLLGQFHTRYIADLKVEDELAKLDAKTTPEDGGEATVAPAAVEAADNIINLSMVAPERVSVEDAQKLIDHPATSDSQKEYLRKFSETRIAENELRDMGAVSKEIADGSKTNMGIKQYRQEVADAIAAGSAKQARSKLVLLTNFLSSHEQKAALAKQAYEQFKVDGIPVQIVRKGVNAPWTIRTEVMQGKSARENGAVTIDQRSVNLVPNINKEAAAIAAAQTELRSAIALRFNGEKNVQNTAPVQATPVGEASSGTSQPVQPPATPSAAKPVAAKPPAVSPTKPVVSPTPVSAADDALYPQAHAIAQTMKGKPVEELAGALKKELGVGWNRAMRMVEGIEAGVTPTVVQSASGASAGNVLKSTTDDSSQLHSTANGTSESSQIAPEVRSGNTEVAPDVAETTTGLSVLKQKNTATEGPSGPLGAVYKTINKAARFLKQKAATKVEKDSDIARVKPLAEIDNFLSKVDKGEIELATFFPDGLNMIDEEGNNRQEAALKNFVRFAKGWSKDIRENLIKGGLPTRVKGNKGGKVPDKAFAFQDPIQDFLNENNVTDENVVTAIAYGAYSWIGDTVNAPMFKEDKESVLEMHGQRDGDLTDAGFDRLRRVTAMEDMVLNDIGQRVIAALGITAKPDAPVDYLPKLATALGVHAMRVLEEHKLVKNETIKGETLMEYMPGMELEQTGTDRDGKPVYPSITYITLARGPKEDKYKLPAQTALIKESNAGSGAVVDKLFDSEKTPTEAGWAPIPFKQQYAKRTQQNISKEQRSTLEKAQQVPHRIIPQMWDALKVLGDTVILQAAGFNTDIENDRSENIQAHNRDSVEAQNENLKQQLENMKALINDALSMSKEKLHQPFFVNYEVWRNFRVGISTGNLNPQSSKIHRFMFYRPEWKATLKTDNVDQFLIAVGQAIGVKVDQQPNSETMGLIDDKIAKKDLDALATRLNDAIKTQKEMSQEDKDAVAKFTSGEEGMQTLQALVAYGKYLEAREIAKTKGPQEFTVHMLVGVDGKTNGPILSQLALGAAYGASGLAELLKMGGMYRAADGVKNFNVWYKDKKSLDLYESLAEVMMARVDLASPTVKAIQVFTKDLLTKEGKVSSAGRKIVKTPLTAFAFGSAVSRSVEAMGEAFIQSIYDKIEAVHNGDTSVTRGQLVSSLRELGVDIADNADMEALMELDFDKFEMKASKAALEAAFKETLGEAAKTTMETYFEVFSNRRKQVTGMVGSAFKIYDALYKDLEAKEIKRLIAAGEISTTKINHEDGTISEVEDHQLTGEQQKALREKIAKMLPQAHTAYSQGEDNLDAGLYMAKTANGRSKKDSGFVKVQIGKRFLNGAGKEVSSVRAKIIERREIEPGAAGLPYMMHSSDSAIMHRALAKFIQAMNVHDEIGNGVDKVADTAKAINGATWQTMLHYSPPTEAFNMLARAVTNAVELNKSGDLSNEALLEIQKEFGRYLSKKERKSVPVNQWATRALNNFYAEQRTANMVRLETMSTMAHIDQYTWEDGQYDITDADRAEALQLLAEQESQPGMPEELVDAAIALGDLFQNGVQPSQAAEPATPLKGSQLPLVPANAAWAVAHAAEQVGGKAAKAVADAVAAGQNVADALNAMEEGADKAALIEAIVKAVDQSVATSPFGDIGQATLESNEELVQYLKDNPKPNPKELVKKLAGIVGRKKDWNSKLQLDLLRALYKLVDEKTVVQMITPQSQAGDVLARPTESSRGWYVAKGPLAEVNLLSPEFVDSNLTPELVIHELLHSVLARAVLNPTGDAKALVADLTKLLGKAQGYVKDNKLTKFDGAVKDVNELLAWGLTNRDFQADVLGKITMESATKGNSLVKGMQKFIATISKYLFKNPTAQQDNGLAVLIANASGLFKHAADNKAPPKTKTMTVLSMAVQAIQGYTTQEVFAALDDGQLSQADTDRITGLLTNMVEKLHGKFGSLKDSAMAAQAATPLDAFIQTEQNGELPFTSEVIASPFRVSSQVAFAVEQVEVTIKAALDSHDAAAKFAYRELDKLYAEAKGLLKGKISDPQYDFLFTPIAGADNRSDYLARFAALAMVHPEVNQHMQVGTDSGIQASGGSFAQQVQRFFEKLLEVFTTKVTGTFAGQAADAKLNRLVSQLVDIEAKHKQGLSQQAMRESITEPLEEAARNLAAKGRKAISAAAKSKYVKGSKNQFIRTAGVVADLYANDRVEHFLDGMKRVRNQEFATSEGILASLVTEARGHLVVFQEILREAKKREGERKDIITDGTKAVLAAFKDGDKLTTEQKQAMAAVFMRSGAHNLLGPYDLKQIEKMLADPVLLNREIVALEKKLGSYGSLKGSVIEQARVLGYYKATGYVRGLLHANAHNISRLLGTKDEGKIDNIMAYRQEANIAALVSLYAIGFAKESDIAAARDVLSIENGRGRENGVEFTLKLHKHMEEESLEKLFKGNPTLMMHGYTPEVYNPNTAIQVVDKEEGDLLVKQGYKRQEKPVRRDARNPGPQMHIYVQRDGGLDRRVTGAFSLKDSGAKGSVLEIENPNAFTKTKMDDWVNQSNKGAGSWKTIANRSDNHAAPIFNENGQITDWRYLMAEDTKNTILERNNNFAELMGRMAGSVYDKQATPVQNKLAAQVLREEYNQSFADEPEAFIKVGASSVDPELREIWNLLPAQTKADVRKIWGQDGMMVRKDSLNILFGYRKLSLANVYNKENKGYIDQAMVALGRSMFGDKAELRTRQFERAWAAIVSELKDIIVVKTGTVLLGNIKSNMWLLAISGVPMKDLVNNHLVALRGATAYRKDSERLAQLKLTRDADYIKGDVKELNDEITRLEDAIARNPVKEMIDAGLMPSIVEDIAASDDIYGYRSKFVRDVDALTARLHPAIKAGAKQVYMAHDTKMYQGLSRITQLSDFVARYTLYQHLTTRKKNPLSKKDAIQQASEAFVNYDIPMHPLLQYLDDMGIIPFMKYFLRIQKVLIRLMKENPARVLGTMLLGNLFNVGETVLDSSALHKVGNNPLTTGAFRFFNTIDELATVSGAMAVFK